jgi:hypothetical protein
MIFRKTVAAFFFFVASVIAAEKNNNIKFSGNTNYASQQATSLVTRVDADYSILLFEPRHEKWAFSLNGKVSMDYDHFGNETRANVFTTIGVEF